MSVADPAYRYRSDQTTTALFAEAERQLNICNSCRYCEGYCAVYPALERRTVLDTSDIIHLANLCHDCRACLYACMYASPHEFGVNPPAILAQVRLATYRSVLPGSVGKREFGRGRASQSLAYFSVVCSIVIVLVLIYVDHGLSSLFYILDPMGSPYAFISYKAILAISLLISGFSLLIMSRGVVAYWRKTRGSLADLVRPGPWVRALSDGATLRYMRGGAEGCYVRENHASSERRILHYLVSYGFLLCFVATIGAAVEQDIFAINPPLAYLSLPVISGTLGGIGLVLGSLGLLRLKRTQDSLATDGPMTATDRYFLIALLILGATGGATLLSRSSSIYGFVLAVHLAVVWSCLILAPSTKFVHFIYRLLALVQDDLERNGKPLAR